MPRREDERYRKDNPHPGACTCVQCERQRLGLTEKRYVRKYPREELPKHPRSCQCERCNSLRKLLEAPIAEEAVANPVPPPAVAETPLSPQPEVDEPSQINHPIAEMPINVAESEPVHVSEPILSEAPPESPTVPAAPAIDRTPKVREIHAKDCACISCSGGSRAYAVRSRPKIERIEHLPYCRCPKCDGQPELKKPLLQRIWDALNKPVGS
jgi:hypothetical protein